VKTLFSTDQVHARDRFDFWHAVACNNLVDHDSRPECRQTFHAKMQTGDLADVGLVLFENAPMGISHTTHHTGRMQADELFICRQAAGTLALDQNGREVLLEAGDVTLLIRGCRTSASSVRTQVCWCLKFSDVTWKRAWVTHAR
jgi:AraC family transcriptional activator of tynA and feaB